jgi:hypothetical protein
MHRSVMVLSALLCFAIGASDSSKFPFNIKLAEKQEGECTEQDLNDFENDKDAKACEAAFSDCANDALCNEFELVCTGVCLKANLKYFRLCNLDSLEQQYRAGCGRGPSGNLCLADIFSETSISFSMNAVSNCPSMAGNCPDDCKAIIERGKDTLGCCLNNFLNDSVIAEATSLSNYSYLVSYDLWSACGVPTDIGFCYGSAWAKSSSAVFGAALIAVLVSMVFEE